MTRRQVKPPVISVENTEKIFQDRIPHLLRQLERQRTVLRIRLLGSEYERLTIITGVNAQKPRPCFSIDYPEGFREAVAGVDPWRFFFEFSGKDNVFYVFRTQGGHFSEQGEIRLNLPTVIERVQRRKDFRVVAGPSLKMSLRGKHASRRVSVHNVSVGGAFFSFEEADEPEAALSSGQILKDLCLEFRSEGTWLRVQVPKAVVKRCVLEGRHKGYRYALQFTEMDKAERAALVELIYALQREHLRKMRDSEALLSKGDLKAGAGKSQT